MSVVRGGDITQILVGGREYDPAPESTVTIILSGKTNENRPTGNGKQHTVQNVKLGGFDGLGISIDPVRRDLEELQRVSDARDPVPMSISTASGITYSGNCMLEGEINNDQQNGTCEIAARGSRFEQL